MSKVKPPKVRWCIRVSLTPSERKRVERAAEIAGRSVASFARVAMIEAAKRQEEGQ